MRADLPIPAKQHLVEVLTVLAIGLVVGLVAAALSVLLRLSGVSAECVHAWLNDPSLGDACNPNTSSFMAMKSDVGDPVFIALALVPFVAGVLAGVPIVSREIEGETAQFAWSVSPSRSRWLLGQVLPIAVLGGLAVAVSAIGGLALLTVVSSAIPTGPMEHVGDAGLPLIARAFASFSIALLVGSVVGRTLPALIGAVAVTALMMALLTSARGAWQEAQPLVALTDAQMQGEGAIAIEQAYVSPSGNLLRYQDAHSVALSAGATEPDLWLLQNGYEPVQVGLSALDAAAWVPIETLALTATGIGLLAGAFAVVAKRRPA